MVPRPSSLVPLKYFRANSLTSTVGTELRLMNQLRRLDNPATTLADGRLREIEIRDESSKNNDEDQDLPLRKNKKHENSNSNTH